MSMTKKLDKVRVRLEAIASCGANTCGVCGEHAQAALLHVAQLKEHLRVKTREPKKVKK